jgi:hypothetical protein
MTVSLVFSLTSSHQIIRKTQKDDLCQNSQQYSNNMLSSDDDATAFISGSGDISSSSLVDSSGSGYDTSLSSSDESPFSSDESPSDENENSQNDDPIMEEIVFLHAKTRILQRASHILLHHQDYQNLLSLQERYKSSARSDAIWNEAKEFLRDDDDSGNENVTNDLSGSSLSALESSTFAVSQSWAEPNNGQLLPSVGSQPYAVQTGSIKRIGSKADGKIDTSAVQCITSQQYQNRLCLSSQVQPIRYSDWVDVCATSIDQGKKNKKRNWVSMENSSCLYNNEPMFPLSFLQEHFLTKPSGANCRRRSESSCRVEEAAMNTRHFRNSPILTMAMESYDSAAEDGQNSLSSASRQNNSSVVLGTVG